MSIHVIPGTTKETGWNPGPVRPDGSRADLQSDHRQGIANRAFDLCVGQLRAPTDMTDDGTNFSLTFTPDLTAGELTTFSRLVQIASASTEITPTEWAAITSDVATVKAFVGIATPTAAQSNAALKATIRVLGALLRS